MLFRFVPCVGVALFFLFGGATCGQQEVSTQVNTHTNHLINETSPYLLQHAHNPVDWYAWGPEAFEAARRLQKPIFLSIGYSTCYWCHVMERESFEDEETARQMNENFICIKVDREERPDVDDLYMAAVQLMSGRGGWPMSVFLTPPAPEGEMWVGLQPFYAGTYFPPQVMGNRPSFRHVLTTMATAWEEQRVEVLEQARRVADAVKQELQSQSAPTALDEDLVPRAVTFLMQQFDEREGGFSSAPKFPQPAFVDLLLGIRETTTDQAGVDSDRLDHVVQMTLHRMAMGGMYDQVGGGFHRYSTDRQWLVPHFEKMLYDNGQLASLYARASVLYDDAYMAEVAGEICDYVLQEMTDEGGGFYSAQDAEVDHREGLNYLWLPGEIEAALDEMELGELSDWAIEVYGVSESGNFKDPHHPDEPARNVLHLIALPEELAVTYGLGLAEVDQRLRSINSALYTVRSLRDQPLTDDKVITAWNGLMIAGMADAGRILDRPELTEAGTRAWRFIDGNLRDADGRRLRTWRDGEAGTIHAVCEDYAFLALGLIALHEATGDRVYVNDAIRLVDEAGDLFLDEQNGGYFDTSDDRDDLFVRSRSAFDGAVPCANSVMLNVLTELAGRTGDERFLDEAMALLASISAGLVKRPLGTAYAVRGLNRLIGVAPDRVAAIGGEVQPESDDLDSKVVGISVEPDRVRLDSVGDTAEVTVVLTIDDGFHLNAHEPGDADLVGLNVLVESGSRECLGADVDYPRGEVFDLGDQPILVYEGEVRLVLRLTRLGEWVEKSPVVSLTYQVCTETECLAPVRRDLPLVIE